MTWPMVRLRYLATLNPPVTSSVRTEVERSYPLLPMDSIHEFTETNSPEIRPVGELLSGYSYLEPTDVAYAKVTPCFENGKGLVGSVLNGPTFATTEITVLRPRASMNQRFLGYILQSSSFRHAAIASMTGAGGLKRVSENIVRDLRVPAPSLDLQDQIVNYLDRETAEIDAFIEELEQLLQLIDERSIASIEAAVLGAGSTTTVDTGQDWPATLPPGWTAQRISWLFNTTGSGTTPASDDADAFGGSIPWITTGELREQAITDSEKKISSEALRRYSALKVHPEESLLIAMYGATIGRLGWLEVPAAVNQAVCVLTGYKAGPLRFAYYALLAARPYLLTLASGGGQPNISQDKIRSLRMPVPPSAEQERIVAELDKALEAEYSMRQDIERSIELAREKRAALISAAVTGAVDLTSIAERPQKLQEVHV